MQLKAVLFDLDGVLLDSEEALYRVYSDWLERVGLPPKPREEIPRFNGMTDEQWLRKLAPQLGGDEILKGARWCDEQYAKVYLRKYAKPTEHAAEVLAALRAGGLKIGVITNQSRLSAKSSVRIVGFDFDSVVTAEDVGEPKPSAEPLLKALAEFSVGANEALYVGDTRTDVEAGRNAGVRTVLLVRPWNARLRAEKISLLSDLMVGFG